MVVLALETATRRGSVGLWRGGRSEGRPGRSVLTHGQRLPGEVLDWLAEHGLKPREVDRYAVVSGPGSFTGLRVGMAAIQGLALPTGQLAVAVPTLEALAEAFLANAGGWRGLLVPCLDGQRGEVFVSAYEVDGHSEVDGCREVLSAEVGRPDDIVARVRRLVSGARHVAWIGDGAVRHAARLGDAMADAEFLLPTMTLAEAAARIGARRSDAAVPPHALRPVYVRRPDAVIARDRRRAELTPDHADPSRLRVRRAADRDFAAVDALQRSTFTHPWGVDAIRWELDNTDVARLYVGETADGQVVAYCACWVVFDELHINSLAVAEPARRQGLARQLLAEVFRDAIRQGARSATLEVRQSNVAARALYESLGFTVEGRRRDYYQTPREDALVLWHRRLAAPDALW